VLFFFLSQRITTPKTKETHLLAWRRATPFNPLLRLLLLPWSRLLLLLLLTHHPRWTILPLQLLLLLLLSTPAPMFPARQYPVLEVRS